MRSAPLKYVLLLAFGAGAAAADSLEGKWLGTIGTPKERVTAGLEFQRQPDGSLKLLLTQPVSNYFGADAGGVLERTGDTIRYPALALELTLEGDSLTGHYPGPNSPASFRRVRRLPQEQAPPARLPAGPEARWQTRIGGQVYADPVLSADGQLVYVGTTGGVFNALAVSDGQLRWTAAIGRPLHGAAAATADAVLFVADDGLLHKRRADDGKPVWTYRVDDGLVSRVLPHPTVFDWDWQGARPLVADGVVYVGGADGSFHAVDLASGQRKWRFQTQGKVRNGAVIAGTRVVFGSADHHVYALETADGREVWRFDTGAALSATPVLHRDRILIGGRSAALFSLKADSGALDWRVYFWGSWVESTVLPDGDLLYVGSSDLRRVSAIDAATGTVRWRTDVYGWTWGTPLLVDDKLYVGAAGGSPYFVRHVASFSTLDRATGKLKTRRPLPDSGGHQWGIAGSPLRAGDLVVVAQIEGFVSAYPLH